MNLSEISAVVDEVINEFNASPIDLLNIGDIGESTYLSWVRETYIRTIRDIIDFKPDRTRFKILEIGCFLGIVAICLSKLGYEVCVTDIPEFMSNRKLQSCLSQNNIEFSSCNLWDYSLPYSNEVFDAVIMCEVLEHLNFNPLPIIKEINRVLKIGGLFYLSLPNFLRYGNRIQMLRGKSIHNPIQDYFDQLDKNKNMIIGLHWREYTISEVKEMLEPLGFNVSKQYYFSPLELSGWSMNFRQLLKKVTYYMCPDLKDNQTTLAIKTKNCETEFFFYEATLPR